MTGFNRPRQPAASLAHHAAPHAQAFVPIPPAYAAGRSASFELDLASMLSAAEIAEITTTGSMRFHCLGDTGGVKKPAPQTLVARGLEQSLHGPSTAPTLRRWRRRSVTISATSSTTRGDVDVL